MVQFGQASFSCSKKVAATAAEVLDSLDGIRTGPPGAPVVRTGSTAWCRDTSPPSGYVFGEASLAVADGVNVVRPLDRAALQPGRWLLFSSGSGTGECCMPSSITVEANYLAVPPFRVIFVAGALPPIVPGPARTVTLPIAPVKDEEYTVKDATGTASAATPIVIDGNGKNIDGTATKQIATAYGAMFLKYDGAEWRIL